MHQPRQYLFREKGLGWHEQPAQRGLWFRWIDTLKVAGNFGSVLLADGIFIFLKPILQTGFTARRLL